MTGEDADNVDKTAERTSSTPIPESAIMSDMFAKVKNNDLVAFKDYLENGNSGIDQYVHTIQYNYGVEPQVYMTDPEENGISQLNPSSIAAIFQNGVSTSSLSTGSSSMSAFQEMLDNQDIIESQMEVVEGRWPESYDEGVLVLSKQGHISDYTLYNLGVYDPTVMKNMVSDALSGSEVTVPEVSKNFTYDDALNLEFSIVPCEREHRVQRRARHLDRHVQGRRIHDEAGGQRHQAEDRRRCEAHRRFHGACAGRGRCLYPRPDRSS